MGLEHELKAMALYQEFMGKYTGGSRLFPFVPLLVPNNEQQIFSHILCVSTISQARGLIFLCSHRT
jgi:hypothetical protein